MQFTYSTCASSARRWFFIFLASCLAACTNSGELTLATSTVPGGGTPVPGAQRNLTVANIGSGTVTSDTGGIDCGSICSATYNNNTTVVLTATPGSGYFFTGWSGPCSGTGTCTIAMSQSRSVTATFNQTGVVDLGCSGPWSGSQETRTITAWPYRDCFTTNPVGSRTRVSSSGGGEVVWEQGTGWNGQNAMRVRPPAGSNQGYAGLGEHTFHDVRTKRLNIRYLIRYNANWAAYAQRNKWEVAIKYDYRNPSSPVRLEGCERGIAEGRRNPSNLAQESFTMQQGVCTSPDLVPNLNGWYFGPGVRENEWISIENEFDLESGYYRTFITTQDGVFNQSLLTQINIAAGQYGAPAEVVPNPYWWGSIDCTAGCFWDYPNDHGVSPRPVDTYIWYSHVVMSTSRIGPPAGFVQ